MSKRSMKPKKKFVLIASVIILALAAVLVASMMPETDSQPDHVSVQCAGFVTNSAGASPFYVISNQNAYAIKVVYYFEGWSDLNVFNGYPITKFVLDAGNHTNVTFPFRTTPPPGVEFHVLYQHYTPRVRLWDFAVKHKLTAHLVPAGWGRSVPLDQHCPLCVR